MTDDHISRIEAALEANPTPGPWFHCQPFQRAEKIRTIHGVVPAQRVDFVATEPKPVHKRIVIPMEGRESNVRSEDMAYIAACNPSAIRALLDRLKDLEMNGSQAVRWAPSSAHWSSELRRLFGADARDGIDALEQRLRDAEAENERLSAEIERLRATLARLACLGNGDRYGNSEGNMIAREALENSDDR